MFEEIKTIGRNVSRNDATFVEGALNGLHIQ